MHTDYHSMVTPMVVDLLARKTEKFTQLMAAREFTLEYEQLKETISQLQAVIASRNSVPITQHDFSFNSPTPAA